MDYLANMELVEKVKGLTETLKNIQNFDLSDYLLKELWEFVCNIFEIINVVAIDIGTIVAMAFLLLYILGYDAGIKKSNLTLAITFLIRLFSLVLIGF